MKVYNETPSSFADKIGVQRSSISHILSGRNKPSLDFIQKIMEHYPKIDAQWLINGKQSNSSKIEVAPEETSAQKSTEPIVAQQELVTEKVKVDDDIKEEIGKVAEPMKNSSTNKGKEIDRIIVFYTDNTFETFNR
jgi:transcriptional regulator with XRE-family HTH domain